ncbi:MAG: hypothetical protein R3E53_14880 [Myxococcota bacterium]
MKLIRSINGIVFCEKSMAQLARTSRPPSRSPRANLSWAAAISKTCPSPPGRSETIVARQIRLPPISTRVWITSVQITASIPPAIV